MKIAIKILVPIVLALSEVASLYAQQCPPSLPDTRQLPLNECRMIANGKGFHWQKDNSMGAGVYLRILGKSSDVIYAPNAEMRVNTDVLDMGVFYYAPKRIIPTSVHLKLRSFSTIPSKYKTNHKLTIYLDDKPLLSADAEVGNSIVIAEQFYLEIKYTDFLKLTEAKKITVQFGETKIKLKPADIEALNDLNLTTKELKPAPPSYAM